MMTDEGVEVEIHVFLTLMNVGGPASGPRLLYLDLLSKHREEKNLLPLH
jgi:hypothetical protein